MKYPSFIIIFFTLLSIACFSIQATDRAAGDARSHQVLVTIAPYKYIVERIAGDTVDVAILVPGSQNMHTYEPSPKQVMTSGKSDLWFQIGENFEKKVLSSLQSYNNRLKVVDLQKGLDLICASPTHQCSHHRNNCDLHFWLDPILMKTQAKNIANALILAYPEYSETYNMALKTLLEDLDTLDDEIQTQLNALENRAFFVSHPAYSYFANRYDLTQYSIEFEGKDPSPKQLTQILETARKNNVRTIFIQKQFNNKGARLVADEIDAKLVFIDPYSEEYIFEMRKIASKIAAK